MRFKSYCIAFQGYSHCERSEANSNRATTATDCFVTPVSCNGRHLVTTPRRIYCSHPRLVVLLCVYDHKFFGALKNIVNFNASFEVILPCAKSAKLKIPKTMSCPTNMPIRNTIGKIIQNKNSLSLNTLQASFQKQLLYISIIVK